MSSQRPTVFIASSVEGLGIAEAIQLNLDRVCQVTIWSQGVFGLSQGTLETLSQNLDEYDFAVFVLTPDDLIISREDRLQAPRDNVLLEMGMFIGAIGRERTFNVYDRTQDIKLPSDLAGITPANFAPHDNGNLQAALGSVCTQIKQAIDELGVRIRSELTGVIDIGESFLIVSDLIGNPGNQFIIQMFESRVNFVRESRGLFGKLEGYEYDSGVGGFDLNKFCKQLSDADILQQSLKNEITLTDRGKEYAAWLIKNDKKADYFRSSKGEWGVKPKWLEGIDTKIWFGDQDITNQVTSSELEDNE